MVKLLKITYNNFPNEIEKIVWDGFEVPWPIDRVVINNNQYETEVIIWFKDRNYMKVCPYEIKFIDNTPEPPKCDCCGQKLPFHPNDPPQRPVNAGCPEEGVQ